MDYGLDVLLMHRDGYLTASWISIAKSFSGLARGISCLARDVFSLVLLFLCLCSQFSLPADATRSKISVLSNFEPVPGEWTKHNRTLLFPESYSLGTLKIKGVALPARGRVLVPAGQTVTFSPSKDFLKDLSAIDKLNPESFDRLNVAAFSLEDDTPSYCDKELPYFAHQKGVIHLFVERSDITDVGLASASQFPNLEKISAFECQIEGRYLKQLCGHKRLRSIDMNCCNLKEEYFKYLPSLPQLQYLNLSHSLTTDAGVKTLANCQGLLVLNLAVN